MVTVAGLDARSLALRSLIVDALEGGGRGHVGSSLSLVEIVRVLYEDVLNVRPAQPRWPDRDRFILSKGHGCLALYVMLAERGFFGREELLAQCRPGALLGGHPETHIPGGEASTGALGHGLAIGVGLALAARMQGRPSRCFVVMGDATRVLFQHDRLSVEEELRFLDQAYVQNGRTGLMLQTLLETGARSSELVQLRVEDVSLAERVITIRQGKGGKREAPSHRQHDRRSSCGRKAADGFEKKSAGQCPRGSGREQGAIGSPGVSVA